MPPLRDIPKVLDLTREQRARVVLLVPDWKMVWYARATQQAWEVLPLEGEGPFFRRLRDGEWQEVEKFLFKPLLLIVDGTRAH